MTPSKPATEKTGNKDEFEIRFEIRWVPPEQWDEAAWRAGIHIIAEMVYKEYLKMKEAQQDEQKTT